MVRPEDDEASQWRVSGKPVPVSGSGDGDSIGWWSMLRIPVLLVVALVVMTGAIFVSVRLNPDSDIMVGAIVMSGFALLFFFASHASYARNFLAELTLGEIGVEITDVVPDEERVRIAIHVPGAQRADTRWIRVVVRGVEIENPGLPAEDKLRDSRKGRAAAASAMSLVQEISEGGNRWWEHNTGDVDVSSVVCEMKRLDEQSRQNTSFEFDLGMHKILAEGVTDPEVLVEIGIPLWPNWRSAVSIER